MVRNDGENRMMEKQHWVAKTKISRIKIEREKH